MEYLFSRNYSYLGNFFLLFVYLCPYLCKGLLCLIAKIRVQPSQIRIQNRIHIEKFYTTNPVIDEITQPGYQVHVFSAGRLLFYVPAQNKMKINLPRQIATSIVSERGLLSA